MKKRDVKGVWSDDKESEKKRKGGGELRERERAGRKIPGLLLLFSNVFLHILLVAPLLVPTLLCRVIHGD